MTYPAYEISRVIPLRNQDYYTYLLSSMASARERVWATIFIVDVRLKFDPYNVVRNLIKNLAYAKWRNVDVKIILGKSETSPDIQCANLTSAKYMKDNGLQTAIFNSPGNSSLHSKYVIIDRNIIILGSHNWTHGGFLGHIEDSIAVNSFDLVYNLAEEFLKLWDTSLEVE